jgi:hypothetical protein
MSDTKSTDHNESYLPEINPLVETVQQPSRSSIFVSSPHFKANSVTESCSDQAHASNASIGTTFALGLRSTNVLGHHDSGNILLQAAGIKPNLIPTFTITYPDMKYAMPLIIHDEPGQKIYKKILSLAEYKARGPVAKPKNVTASPLDKRLADEISDESLMRESGDDVAQGMEIMSKKRQVHLTSLDATRTHVLQKY